MLINHSSRWGVISQSLHWLVAAIIYFSLLTGLMWWLRAYIPVGVAVIISHKTAGLFILALAVTRVLWRFLTVSPKKMTTLSRRYYRLLRYTQWLLVALIFIMPVSGWMMSTASGYKTSLIFTKVAMPGVQKDAELAYITHLIHEWAALILVLLLAFHVFSALWHHYVFKDALLVRMLPRFLARRLRVNRTLP